MVSISASAPGPSEAQSTHPAGSSPAARRVRDRLVRLGSSRTSPPAVLEPLLQTLRTNHPKADLRPVHSAFDLAYAAHEGQVRRSGEPYITHPVAVGQILADLGMDVPTVVAAILHDVVEDTAVSIELVKNEFGPTVAMVVDGVTKLDQVSYGEHAQAETMRKMVVAMARDPRVLVVKLADRLHNMRTLGFLPPAKQEKKAKETLEIFAPLAHRLGMNTIKWELEDLAFATLQPKVYDEIVRLVADRAPAREGFMAKVIEETEQQLKDSKIKATVTGRPKHYYSIYQKMIVRGRDFADIYDLVGVRVLVDDVRDCYAALGQIHASWNPVPGRFKDFIAMPKFNMYQSLHTTVIGPTGKPVEFQIRTWEMHNIADLGIAAHWKYKEQLRGGKVPTGIKGAGAAPADSEEMAWLRQILDWQRETSDPSEFLDSLRYDLQSSEVFVFSPKGDVISLPAGSTPVDFAYSVHTEVGNRCIGSRVNGRLVPLESQLKNGDTVEIFTSKAESAGPSRDWLSFVASSRAKSKIRHWFAKERREDALEHGKDALSRAMRKAGLPLQRLFAGDTLTVIARDMRFQDVESLYVAVGENHVSAGAVIAKLVAFIGGTDDTLDEIAETPLPVRQPASRRSGNDPGVVVTGLSDMWVKLARCCTPVPGDEIVGFVTRGQGVSVHQKSCINVASLATQEERFVEVEWAPRAGSVFMVCIQVEALDRQRLLSDVTRVLSDAHVNILSAYVHTSKDRTAISRFTFEMGGPEHLGHLLRMVKQIDGVFDAYRVSAAN